MKVFLNPGHDLVHDSGAVHPRTGLRECDVAAAVGDLVRGYLENAGCEVRMLQSDNLNWESDYVDRQDCSVCDCANAWPADVFVSIHCNAANGRACGTETLICGAGGRHPQRGRQSGAACRVHPVSDCRQSRHDRQRTQGAPRADCAACDGYACGAGRAGVHRQ